MISLAPALLGDAYGQNYYYVHGFGVFDICCSPAPEISSMHSWGTCAYVNILQPALLEVDCHVPGNSREIIQSESNANAPGATLQVSRKKN